VFTGAEAGAASIVAFLATAIVAAYVEDAIGLTLHPGAILVVCVGAGAAVAVLLRRRAVSARTDFIAFAGIVGGVLSWLLWLAWPALLPIGNGPDLTHHLLLIDYIERTGRLVHDPALSGYLGEMIDYTPGSHLLSVLAGRWTQTDGLHAVYAVVALSVAIKAGMVFLITLRCLPTQRTAKTQRKDRLGFTLVSFVSCVLKNGRLPIALLAVLLLFVPRMYFIGSFAQQSFVAQVVAESFAVAMWWAILAWDQQPTNTAAAVFAIAGCAAFLTWPVWVGPMLVALVGVAVLHRDLPVGVRLRHLAIGILPIAAVALLHAFGRAGAAAIASTSGFVIKPTTATLGWVFPSMGIAGTIVAAFDKRTRTIALLGAAIGVQALALFALARTHHAGAPYLALKMFYLAIYPLAVAGAVAASWALAQALPKMPDSGTDRVRSRGAMAAWIVVFGLAVVITRGLGAMPRPTPVVSDSVNNAGRWARAHVPPQCVDYLVADDDSAYWLHLAVLGNARAAARSLDSSTYEPKDAVVRWILPNGLPYAIADRVDDLPKDIRETVDVLARFGPAAVIKRRGRSVCPP